MGNFAVADLSLDRQLNPDQAIYLAGGYQADDTQMYVYGAGTDAMLPSFAISNMTLIDRNSYAGCYVKSRQSIFYLGGISRDGIKSPGEITEFVPATKSWSFLTFKGPSAYRPPHRVNLCIVANDDGTKVVVFGGYNFTDTLDTMVLYNIDTNQLAFNYTPPPSYLNNDGNESKKIAVITCSVLVAVLALAGIGFWFLRRRRRRQRNPGLWMTYKNILGRESPFSTKYSKADARVDESASRWYDQDSTLSSRSKMVPIRTVEDLSYQYYSLQQQQQVVGTVEPKDNKYEYDPLMTSSRASQAPHTLFPQNPHTLSTDQILQQAQRQLEKQKIEVLLQQQQLLLQHQRRELIIGNMNRGQSRGVRPGVGALVGAGGVPSPVLGFGGIIDLTSGGVVPVGAGGDLGHDSGGGDGGCGGSIETLEQQTQQVQLQLYRLEKRQRQLQQQQHQQQW
ncbi:hypothetical protein BGZ83_004716 [Gryganskiella cystojenkinii]|nr:hypothetical protein BGZ83_004716 [Gryganskiella cystojenkinii]